MSSVEIRPQNPVTFADLRSQLHFVLAPALLAAACSAVLEAHRQHVDRGFERRSGRNCSSEAAEQSTRLGDVHLLEIGTFGANAATTSYCEQLAKRLLVLLIRDERNSARSALLRTCCALSRRRAFTAEAELQSSYCSPDREWPHDSTAINRNSTLVNSYGYGPESQHTPIGTQWLS